MNKSDPSVEQAHLSPLETGGEPLAFDVKKAGYNETLLLFTLAAINFTHIVDFMIMMPLGPQLMRLLGINSQQHAALVSTYTYAAGVAGFFAAFAVDRFDRKKALLISYTFFIVGTVACAFAPNYQLLLTTRALTGTFGGLLAGIVLAIIGDVIPLARRGAAMGKVMVSFSLASVVGVPIGLFFAAHLGWHAPFIFVGLLGLVVLGFIIKLVPPMRQHILYRKTPSPMPLEIIKRVWRDKNQVRALSFTVFIMLGQFAMIPFISPYMVSNVGFGEHQLPWIYLLGGGATIFTAPAVGRLADRFGKFKIFSVFSLLLIIPTIWISTMGVTSLYIALIATTLFFIFTNGRFVPSMTMVTAVVPPSERGSFMSFNSCVQQISAGLAATIGGALVSNDAQGSLLNYDRVGYWAVALTLVAWWMGKKIRLID